MARRVLRRRWLTSALMLALTASTAETIRQPDPLFQGLETIEIRITGPMTTLMRERPDDRDMPGTASWREPDGRTVEVDIGLRTRGNYRRQGKNCQFAPVRLDFRSGDVKDTLFHKQDKLKLVTHCRNNSSKYQQAVFREYLTYRLLNALTDVSYRVRLLQVTYVNTENSMRELSAHAFVIESKQRFSKRTGLPIVEVPGVELYELDGTVTNLTSVFQYMIGNTDYSPLAGAAGENCCHNINLFGGDDTALFPIPYDFDITGMTHAPYATPNPRFRLHSVRDRLYRGRCAFNNHLPATIQRFRDARAELYAIVENEATLTKSSRKSMQRFLDSFFKTIDNPKTFERKIVKACVGPYSVDRPA